MTPSNPIEISPLLDSQLLPAGALPHSPSTSDVHPSRRSRIEIASQRDAQGHPTSFTIILHRPDFFPRRICTTTTLATARQAAVAHALRYPEPLTITET